MESDFRSIDVSDNMYPLDNQGPDDDLVDDTEAWPHEHSDTGQELDEIDLDPDHERDSGDEHESIDDLAGDFDLFADDLDIDNDSASPVAPGDASDDADASSDPNDSSDDTDSDPDSSEALELGLDTDSSTPYNEAQVAELLTDLDVDVAEFDRTMRDLGLHAESDGRSVVVTLEQLEVESNIEYAGADRLAELLVEGADVRLASGHRLTAVDDHTDEAVLERDGVTERMAMNQLESRWSAHAFEMVVAATADGPMVLLPAGADTLDSNGGLSG